MAYRVSKVARKSGPQFKLRYEWFESGKRKSRDVPKKEWTNYGFYEVMTLEQAQAQRDSLNAAEHEKRHQERRNKIAVRLKDQAIAQLAHLPAGLIGEYEEKLFGRTHQTKKLSIYWANVKSILTTVKLEPALWVDNKGQFYDLFLKRKYSMSYVRTLVSMLNAWGKFYSRKTQKFFDPLPTPISQERERIADANYMARNKPVKTTKEEKSYSRGNKESLPITPKMLTDAQSKFLPEHYNWLYLTVWFGLRPIEVDGLKDPRGFKIEQHGNIKVLSVYQSKLTAIAREKRWKLIPCFLPEQREALEIILSGKFRRPLTKTVTNWFNAGVGLYGGRKGFVDLMQGHGQSLEDISQWLGHTTIERTWKSYKNKQKVRFTVK